LPIADCPSSIADSPIADQPLPIADCPSWIADSPIEIADSPIEIADSPICLPWSIAVSPIVDLDGTILNSCACCFSGPGRRTAFR
jgi:hypothetical protein